MYGSMMRLVLLLATLLVCCSAQDVGCNGEADIDWCGVDISRFFFNEKSRKCEKFTWGGCDNNNNNHLTDIDCQLTCMVKPFRGETMLIPILSTK